MSNPVCFLFLGSLFYKSSSKKHLDLDRQTSPRLSWAFEMWVLQHFVFQCSNSSVDLFLTPIVLSA